MKYRNVENRLAIAGALLALFGVAFAANSALADEPAAEHANTIVATQTSDTADVVDAKAVNREAADDAAERIAADNKLELEVRLLDRKSTTVARRTI